jgi:hypothetical protein
MPGWVSKRVSETVRGWLLEMMTGWVSKTTPG